MQKLHKKAKEMGIAIPCASCKAANASACEYFTRCFTEVGEVLNARSVLARRYGRQEK